MMRIHSRAWRLAAFALATSLLAGCVAGSDEDGEDSDLGEENLNGTPSSKSAVAISTLSMCGAGGPSCLTTVDGATEGAWRNVMSSTIKTSSISDLFVDVSLVTGIYTSTNVKGNNTGSTSTSTAMGGVKVRVLLDGQPTVSYPDRGEGVTFDQRVQTMTANLGNIFTKCFADGGNTGTGCTLTPSEVEIALDTTSAHSFGYILPNVGAGTHTVTVQAQVNTSATGSNGGVAIANAMYGLGMMAVDKAQLVNSFTF